MLTRSLFGLRHGLLLALAVGMVIGAFLMLAVIVLVLTIH